MLKALLTTLPYKGRSASIQQRYLRMLLIARGIHVDPKTLTCCHEIVVEGRGANSQTIAVNRVVFPDEKAARGVDACVGMRLHAGQEAHDRIFTSAVNKPNLAKTEEGQSRGDAACQQTFADPN